MNNPLNELSAVYNQNIAEGCGCDKKKVKVELSGTKRPDGGDGAAPNDGKNLLPTGDVPMGGSGAKRRVSKYAVEPLATEEYKELPKRKMGMKAGKKTLSALGHALKTGTDGLGSIEDQKRGQKADKKARQADKIHSVAKSHNATLSKMKSIKNKVTGMTKEGYAPGDVDQKVGAVTSIPKDEREAAKERLLAKAKAKRASKLKEGHCDEEGVKCSPVEKKKDSKKSMKENFYSNWREDLIEVVDPADSNEMVKSSPKTDTQAQKEIKEKKVNNKIKINPPQGVTEGFQELGGVVLEMYELTEADMTGAPSIKDAKPAKKINVKYDPKMKVMAPQINKEETEEEKKKRELQAKTKEHDDKMAGKLAEQSGGGLSKLGPRESDKRKEKGKSKPQAIRQSKARLAALKKRLNVEETGAEFHARMKKKVMPWEKPNTTMSNTTPEVKAKMAARKAAKKPTDTRTDAQKMADATGPRPGSRYRGD